MSQSKKNLLDLISLTKCLFVIISFLFSFFGMVQGVGVSHFLSFPFLNHCSNLSWIHWSWKRSKRWTKKRKGWGFGKPGRRWCRILVSVSVLGSWRLGVRTQYDTMFGEFGSSEGSAAGSITFFFFFFFFPLPGPSVLDVRTSPLCR